MAATALFDVFGWNELDRLPPSAPRLRRSPRRSAAPEVTFDVPSAEDALEILAAVAAEEEAARQLALDAEVSFEPLPEADAAELLAELAQWEIATTRRMPDISVELTYRSHSTFYADLAGDNVGLFVPTFVARAPGDRLLVCFSLPELDEPVVAHAVVSWTRGPSEDDDSLPGLGVVLEDLPEQVRRAIAAFTQVRPPLLHDV